MQYATRARDGCNLIFAKTVRMVLQDKMPLNACSVAWIYIVPAATTLRTHPELKAERAASHGKCQIGPK